MSKHVFLSSRHNSYEKIKDFQLLKCFKLLQNCSIVVMTKQKSNTAEQHSFHAASAFCGPSLQSVFESLKVAIKCNQIAVSSKHFGPCTHKAGWQLR